MTQERLDLFIDGPSETPPSDSDLMPSDVPISWYYLQHFQVLGEPPDREQVERLDGALREEELGVGGGHGPV